MAGDIAATEPIRQTLKRRRKQTAPGTRKRRTQTTTQPTERTFLDETNASEDELLDDLLASDLDEEEIIDIEDISDSDSDSEGATQHTGLTISQLIDEL